MAVPAPGPRAAEVARAGADGLAIARLRIEEARLTGDPGFYSLAEQAASCALAHEGGLGAQRLLTHIHIQFHQFARAETEAAALVAASGTWQDHMLLGDAQMEQGKIDAAAASYQVAMDTHPGMELYDRASWLRWLTGDLPGAVELQQLAVSGGSAGDPEPYAWVLTRLGWLHLLQGKPAPELTKALQLVPDYAAARLAQGRFRLHLKDPLAASDLAFVAHTVEGARALAEIDTTVSVDAVGAQDPRGYGIWLADRDPARALPLLEQELTQRQDAVTHMAHAYAAFRAGQDAEAEARAALVTGIIEPRVLLEGGLLLGDAALLRRALGMGPGLLPSERAQAEAALENGKRTPTGASSRPAAPP
jgi:tetratricopeptide (TPR) repeat protein